MPRVGTYDEQWTNRMGHKSHRYLVRVRPIPSGSWGLRPRNNEFDSHLVFWGGMDVPDDQSEDGTTYWTVYFAFREAPYLHLEHDTHDGEVAFVVDEHAPHEVMVRGFKFRPTVDGTTPVAEVEVLDVIHAAEPVGKKVLFPKLRPEGWRNDGPHNDEPADSVGK